MAADVQNASDHPEVRGRSHAGVREFPAEVGDASDPAEIGLFTQGPFGVRIQDLYFSQFAKPGDQALRHERPDGLQVRATGEKKQRAHRDSGDEG